MNTEQIIEALRKPDEKFTMWTYWTNKNSKKNLPYGEFFFGSDIPYMAMRELEDLLRFLEKKHLKEEWYICSTGSPTGRYD